MDTPARWATPLTLVALASFLPLASIPASGSPLPQNAAAVRATDDAVKLIQENRVQEALETLDRAIVADAGPCARPSARPGAFKACARTVPALGFGFLDERGTAHKCRQINEKNGGAEGVRTPDPDTAGVVLVEASQVCR